MWLFKRTCPRCGTETSIKKRIKLIHKMHIECSNCQAILQPTILWGILMAATFAIFFFKSLYIFLEYYLGTELAYAILIFLSIALAKLTDPFSNLVAHDKDDCY